MIADKKMFLVRYLKDPKTHNNTYIRENEPLRMLVDKLREKYGLNSRQQVYELAVLSVGLDIPPEKLAPFLQKRTKAHSKKALLEAYEVLIQTDLG